MNMSPQNVSLLRFQNGFSNGCADVLVPQDLGLYDKNHNASACQAGCCWEHCVYSITTTWAKIARNMLFIMLYKFVDLVVLNWFRKPLCECTSCVHISACIKHTRIIPHTQLWWPLHVLHKHSTCHYRTKYMHINYEALWWYWCSLIQKIETVSWIAVGMC